MGPCEPITRETLIPIELERRPTERVGTLTVLSGASVGAVLLLEGDRIVIGRGDQCPLVLDHDSVSRLHACVYREGEQYWIEDLGSTNGTFVGGDRVVRRVPLSDGSRVRVASCVLRFSLQDPLEADAARQVYERGVRDALTGVYNRRYFDERLRNEIAFAMRHRTPLCVIACDVDHFKRINDGLGHPAGDAVLKRVANLLHDAVRTEDVFARCGGEEFAVIARGIDVAGAIAFGERLRKLIEQARITWQGSPVPVTISLGIAHNQASGRVADVASFVASADKALYEAKRLGRNRTQLSGSAGRYSGMEPEPTTPTPIERPKPRRRYVDQDTAPAHYEDSGPVRRASKPRD